MHSSQRHALIREHVNLHGFASLEELADLCKVSEQTVRRDIAQLSSEGQIARLHGGAGAVAEQDRPFELRRRTNVDAKQIVGRLLADIIPDRATMFIGGGSTMEAAGQYLLHKQGLFVLTINLHVALAMQRCANSTIYVPHGQVQLGSYALTGSSILDCIDMYSMDICLLSTASIHENGDFYENNHGIAANLKAMKKRARRVILAADSGKFFQGGVVRVGNLSEVSTLVTDAPPPPAVLELLDKHRVELLCPSKA